MGNPSHRETKSEHDRGAGRWSCLSPECILRPQTMAGSPMRTLTARVGPPPLLRRQAGKVQGNEKQLLYRLWHVGPVLSVVRNKNPTCRGFHSKDTWSLTPLKWPGIRDWFIQQLSDIHRDPGAWTWALLSSWLSSWAQDGCRCSDHYNLSPPTLEREEPVSPRPLSLRTFVHRFLNCWYEQYIMFYQCSFIL